MFELVEWNGIIPKSFIILSPLSPTPGSRLIRSIDRFHEGRLLLLLLKKKNTMGLLKNKFLEEKPLRSLQIGGAWFYLYL